MENPHEEELLHASNASRDVISKVSEIVEEINRNFLKNLTNPTRVPRNLSDPTRTPGCNYHQNLLEHAMLIYSFVHGIMSLLNATYDCKSRQKRVGAIRINVQTREKDPNTEEEPETVSKPEQMPQIKKRDKYLYILIAFTWVLPVLASSTVCLICDCSSLENFNNETNRPGFVELLKAINVSTPNKTEVSKIVENVFRIVHEAAEDDRSQNNYSPSMLDIVKNLNSKRTSRNLRNFAGDINVKVHTFLVFILAFFAVILYASLEYAKMTKCLDSKKLRLFISSFVLNWTPAALETFHRIYIANDGQPQLISNVLLALGNAQKMLLNFVKLRDMNKTSNALK